MYVWKTARWSLIFVLMALPLAAQSNDMAALIRAQQALTMAEAAGAPVFAKSLYDDAAYRMRFAQENWNAKSQSKRGEAEMRALEAASAAQAAAAKARWLSTNAAIHNLQLDIVRFGGTSDIMFWDESPTIDFNRGATTKDRIAVAQSAVDQARIAGAEQSVPDNDLAIAAQYIDSAKKVSRASAQSDPADDLAYRAEMIGRRAYYLAQLSNANKLLARVQLDRTRLAQGASERQAMAERAQREEAERHSAELQQRLAAEQANRQAQAAEVDRLRQQIEETNRAAQARIEADRQARIAAEQQLDQAYTRYLSAIANSTPSDIDAARRQVEDQQIALRAIQDRERISEESLQADITRMRNDLNSVPPGTLRDDVMAQRQANLQRRQLQLDQIRADRQADLTARAERERQEQQAIADAQARRQEAEAKAAAERQAAEAQAAALRQQADLATQQAQQAQAQAQQAQTAAEQAQAAAQQTQAQLDQARQEMAKRDEEARQKAEQAQAQLEQTRKELAERDAEARRLRMEQEIARLAATRTEQRGFIITLPGIFFDTGKSVLKSGAKKTLARIADQLKTDDTLRITVEGHTDNRGSEESNQKLSEKRAQAVRDFLVGAGFPGDHITAVGKGDADPIATNKTAAGRQQNRRVELVVTH